MQTHNPNPNTLQNALLNEFVDEAKDLSKKVDRTITDWKASNNDGIHLRKKTSASLELLREALTDKMSTKHGQTWQGTIQATKLRKTRYQGRSKALAERPHPLFDK